MILCKTSEEGAVHSRRGAAGECTHGCTTQTTSPFPVPYQSKTKKLKRKKNSGLQRIKSKVIYLHFIEIYFACHMQCVHSVEAGRGGVGGTALNETRGGRIVGLLS